MYCIRKPIEGISLNGDEYLLNDKNEVMIFETKKLAEKFCNENKLDIECISSYEEKKYSISTLRVAFEDARDKYWDEQYVYKTFEEWYYSTFNESIREEE